MDKIIVKGGKKLSGSVKISGAKNAVLPIMAATLLTKGKSVIHNVPNLRDVRTMANMLRIVGAKVSFQNSTMEIDTTTYDYCEAPYDLVKKMRASIYVLGPLVAKMGNAKVSLPGGCAIGARPINFHLEGMKALGANVELKHGYIVANADRLTGTEIYFDYPSVGATCNIMMAATLAKGKTILKNVAQEPHVVNLADCLIKMGAAISGVGTETIIINGVDELHPCECYTMSDYIETGTYMIAGAITGSNIEITNCDPKQVEAVTAKMRQAGIRIEENQNSINIFSDGNFKAVNVTTLPYPGFPTDMQAQMMALLCLAKGTSIVTDTVWKNRFMHVMELKRLGADIELEDNSAVVNGVESLSGAPVMATDLRASAALVLAGLVAEGETHISRVYHIDRGYEKIEQKLSALGADIERVRE
jgi:UDP-N-acetylglucosamine 1-carboxyvinyltransferase